VTRFTTHRRSARRVAIAVAAVAGLVLAPATSAQAAAVRVKATASRTFVPARVRIAPGTKVVWKAVGLTHTVTAYKGHWSKKATIVAGQTTSFRFKSTGRYLYRCTIHSTLTNGVCAGMCAKIIVR
jgi:plastocyanin